MKDFNITAQVYDVCGSNPSQMILMNEIINAHNSEEAEKKFTINLLIDDIVVNKILSTEEISQDAA